jgi:two-component system, OmpR family, phosphate regulon response regulator PhoB
MTTSPTILIIEDEKDIAQLIAYNLQQEGFRTKTAAEGEDGYEKALHELPDFIVLDLMLPKIGGLEVCRKLKTHPKSRKIPILILTAKGEEIDRVVGFEVGADDYMVKPFSPRELVLRIKAILKRSGKGEEEGGPSSPLQFGAVELDPVQHRVWIEKKEIILTATEFKLLEYLLRSQGRVLTRDLLLDKVWGYDVAVTTRTVDTHIKRLREKLGKGGDCIETVRGVGYRLKESF